jgi:hypothetical protein
MQTFLRLLGSESCRLVTLGFISSASGYSGRHNVTNADEEEFFETLPAAVGTGYQERQADSTDLARMQYCSKFKNKSRWQHASVAAPGCKSDSRHS